MPKATLTVMTLKGGMVKQLVVDYKRDTVAELQRMVAANSYGASPSDIKLLYRAKPLFDGCQKLADAGIRGDSTIHWVYRTHGGSPMGAQEVLKQVRAVQKAKLHGVLLLEVDEDDPMTVNIALEGADGTPFEGRQLFMTLKFPSDYPRSRPTISFHHPLYHPNIYKASNKLCWGDDDNSGSTYSLEAIIGMVDYLMAKPNPDSPANRDAAELYVRDAAAWAKEAHSRARDVLFKV